MQEKYLILLGGGVVWGGGMVCDTSNITFNISNAKISDTACIILIIFPDCPNHALSLLVRFVVIVKISWKRRFTNLPL